MKTFSPVRLIAAGAAAALATSAHAGLETYDFPLSGFQESPPVTTPATGEGLLIYDPDTQTFDLDLIVYEIELADLMGVGPNSTPAHIHMGAPNTNGPIVLDIGFMASFVQDDTVGGIRLTIDDGMLGGTQGGVMSDPDDVENALRSGGLYVNVHTNDFPGGEVRGQIVPSAGALAAFGVGGLGLAARRRRNA